MKWENDASVSTGVMSQAPHVYLTFGFFSHALLTLVFCVCWSWYACLQTPIEDGVCVREKEGGRERELLPNSGLGYVCRAWNSQPSFGDFSFVRGEKDEENLVLSASCYQS